MRTRIKFCGCTNVRDAQTAVELGVDAIGVIFAPASPRRVSVPMGREIAAAIPAFVTRVGVFVEPAPAEVDSAIASGYIAQFSGNETAPDCERVNGPYIKVFHFGPEAGRELELDAFARMTEPYARATWMFDTAVAGLRGGTGRTFDWSRARAVAGARRIIVSGGLTADNVGACITQLRPYGVDVRSGIETDGVKDADKMRAFVRAVKEADAQT